MGHTFLVDNLPQMHIAHLEKKVMFRSGLFDAETDVEKERHLITKVKYVGGPVMFFGCFNFGGPGAWVKLRRNLEQNQASEGEPSASGRHWADLMVLVVVICI